jgi:glucokinase
MWRRRAGISSPARAHVTDSFIGRAALTLAQRREQIPVAMPSPEAIEAPLTLGVDIGGTKIEVALVDAAGRVVRSRRQPTDAARGAASVIDDIATAVADSIAAAHGEALAVGVAVAGQVDAHGIVRGAPNLEWQDVPLRAELARRVPLPVVAVNDVRAAAWAEWRHGAGAGSDDVVVLFIGTGIGGSVVSQGRMLEGATNTAGEIGHTTLVAGGRQCHCRNHGCLEAYVGGWAIGERARDAVAADPAAGAALIALAGAAERITAGHVCAAVRTGDALAHRVIEETGELLGAAAVSFVNGFNPSVLVIGGGVVDGLPELVPMAERFVRAHALPAALGGLRVVPAALANDAPAIGAATLARTLITRNDR